MLAFNIVLLVFFFGKRQVFPKAYVALMAANIVFSVSDQAFCSAIPSVAAQADNKSHQEMTRAVVYSLLWCAYMLTSKRVKATFVR